MSHDDPNLIGNGHCWVHPSIEVKPSPIAGNGLFASTLLPAGTIVIRLAGRLIGRAALRSLFAAAANTPEHPYIDCLSIDEGLDLLLTDAGVIHYGNHSCDPNIWHDGPFVLTTRREIAAGEEIVLDYGTQTDNDEFVMACHCRSTLCRGNVTGLDWQRSDLQQRYGDHWVPVLLKRIADQRARHS